MSPLRRDGEGRIEAGPTWESIVERRIRVAMDEGAFDDLPFRGERLPLEDDSAAGEWALAFRVLRNAGAAPPWIEADLVVRALLERRDALLRRAGRSSPLARRRDRRLLTELVERINRAIERLNAEAPTDRQQRRPLGLDAELEAFDRAHADARSGQDAGSTSNR